jgi:glucuronokinase
MCICEGDNEVHDAMKQFGELTSKARVAIEEQDWNTLAALMNSNFDLRRKIYGDECLGSQNIEMIEIARRVRYQNKLTSSFLNLWIYAAWLSCEVSR